MGQDRQDEQTLQLHTKFIKIYLNGFATSLPEKAKIKITTHIISAAGFAHLAYLAHLVISGCTCRRISSRICDIMPLLLLCSEAGLSCYFLSFAKYDFAIAVKAVAPVPILC